MSMTAEKWLEEAFFEAAPRESVDGGYTSSGPLWHSAPARWGHSMHSMCSYHGMFPARLVHHFLQAFTGQGDVVLDPFSGRGTVVLQARAEGRRAIGNDLNPLAFVLSRSKAAAPPYDDVLRLLGVLERDYHASDYRNPDVSPDISMLYHSNTLRQILFLRAFLLTEPITQWNSLRSVIAGCLAGIMHGSARRGGSSQYLSISMPNTFSMSPAYVRKFILENDLVPPDQDVFERLRDKLARVYLDALPGPVGEAHYEDAAALMSGSRVAPESVDLILTSPPYLGVVNYGTANWIRLWLIGVEEVGRERGRGRRALDEVLDHRHTYDTYRRFIHEVLKAMSRVLKPDGVAAVVIGDVADPGKSAVPLARKIWNDVGGESGLRLDELIEDHIDADKKVSRIWGDTRGQATNRDCVLLLSRADGVSRRPIEVLDWEEAYKDGGPDAAHERVRSIR